jgi:hypothetical protein
VSESWKTGPFEGGISDLKEYFKNSGDQGIFGKTVFWNYLFSALFLKFSVRSEISTKPGFFYTHIDPFRDKEFELFVLCAHENTKSATQRLKVTKIVFRILVL